MSEERWLLLGRDGQRPVDRAGARRIAAFAAALAAIAVVIASMGVSEWFRHPAVALLLLATSAIGPGLLAGVIAYYWRQGRNRARRQVAPESPGPDRRD